METSETGYKRIYQDRGKIIIKRLLDKLLALRSKKLTSAMKKEGEGGANKSFPQISHAFNSLLLTRTETNLRSLPSNTNGEDAPGMQDKLV